MYIHANHRQKQFQNPAGTGLVKRSQHNKIITMLLHTSPGETHIQSNTVQLCLSRSLSLGSKWSFW